MQVFGAICLGVEILVFLVSSLRENLNYFKTDEFLLSTLLTRNIVKEKWIKHKSTKKTLGSKCTSIQIQEKSNIAGVYQKEFKFERKNISRVFGLPRLRHCSEFS